MGLESEFSGALPSSSPSDCKWRMQERVVAQDPATLVHRDRRLSLKSLEKELLTTHLPPFLVFSVHLFSLKPEENLYPHCSVSPGRKGTSQF